MLEQDRHGRSDAQSNRRYDRSDVYSPEPSRRRMDSPSDAFKEVFEEYGAKLSPELMRL